jgi:polyribonucleotide nucleotidyltransferase
MIIKKEMEINGRTLTIETGRVARQADGAVLIQYGETIVLATVVSAREPKEDTDFFPLMVDYRESAYSAGKIPGGFFRREGRPSEKEILSGRLIDRPIRPLFPEGYWFETVIHINVISSDKENNADMLGGIGASAALSLSDIPFQGPVASVRVGRIEGKFIINPTFVELENSDLEIVVAGTKNSIAMVEGEAKEISEEEILEAILLAHETIKQIIDLQETMIRELNPVKRTFEPAKIDQELQKSIESLSNDVVHNANRISDKTERNNTLKQLKDRIINQYSETVPDIEKIAAKIIDDLQYNDMRQMILVEKRRLDGRQMTEVRPITCDIGFLPRVHGSALFTRGQTQALVASTLGTKMDEQFIDGIDGDSTKRFMFHYNFPPYSVGEARPTRGPGRREIGHGNLAERALKLLIPNEETFPYTIRVVSDILESNGSSSMASVCGGSLSLMDAGVPMPGSVAGIAMGLIMEDGAYAILSDILGDEDHLGDMDFKVAGTRKGITACQMDIKIRGISPAIMKEALEQAKQGRFHIISVMEQTIDKSKPDLSKHAPRITTLKIKVDQIGLVIGPGGKTIREIIEKSGTKIDISDDGTVLIASITSEGSEIAVSCIRGLTEDPEIGKIYKGTVKKITDFGAFVEILPGKEGLLHISEIDHKRVAKVEEYMKLGDEVEVLLQEIVNRDGKTKYELSRKALIKREPQPKKP